MSAPRRFQWPEEDQEIAQMARRSIPKSTRAPALEQGYRLKSAIWCPIEEEMIDHEPSESVDSERTLPAIRAQFSDRTIQPIGGLIYMMALGNAVSYAKGENEQRWLRDWLHVDWGARHGRQNLFRRGHLPKVDRPQGRRSGSSPATASVPGSSGHRSSAANPSLRLRVPTPGR
ncbi:hypothetical protein [Jannaschia seohaensis]|uniref:hypothetical protein n=1 Tax=Jannaschia seohaensis TaxID=475081 RepID=UPI0011B1D687|nr:hypothetical protein [Jannaschia seohaensis]